MAKEIRITCASNAYGVKVKRCCASCRHKEITNEGARVCALMKRSRCLNASNGR